MGRICADLFRIRPQIQATPRLCDGLFLDARAGYARLSRQTNAGRWTLWMRGGGFGFPPDYGHAHSDDLSPLVCLDGKPLLWESGTYRYSIETEERLVDVLSQGHSGIRCDMRERATWSDMFRWRGEPLAAELGGDPDSLVGRLVLPDRSTLTRRVLVSPEGVVIHDSFESRSPRERLFEWSFILEGKEIAPDVADDGIVRFRHLQTPREFSLRFSQGWRAPWSLRPVRISSGYAESHEGTRLSIRSIERGDWTRVTILSPAELPSVRAPRLCLDPAAHATARRELRMVPKER